MNGIEQSIHDRKLLSAIVDIVPTPLFVKGSDCQLIVLNTACEEMLGVDTDSLLKRPRRMDDSSGDGYMQIDKWVYGSGSTQVVEEKFLSAKGVINLRTTKKPCYDETGNPVCMLCVPEITMTSSQSIRCDLDPHFLHLHRLSTLGMFVTGIAHDIRNVIAGVQGSLGVIRKKVVDSPHVPDRSFFDWLDRVEHSCGHGVALLGHMLLYGSSNKNPAREVISLGEVIESARVILETNNDLLIHFDDDGGTLVEVNATQLQQVLINLCMNSLQARTKRTCRVEISAQLCEVKDGHIPGNLHGVRNGEYVRITVADDSKGISPGDIKKIFEPFFSTGKEANFGLGLQIVRDIVHAHNGYISVRSEEGRGTTFEIYLPKADL